MADTTPNHDECTCRFCEISAPQRVEITRLRAALTTAEQELATLRALAREVVTTLTAGAANGASHAIMAVNLEPVRRLAAALPEETAINPKETK